MTTSKRNTATAALALGAIGAAVLMASLAGAATGAAAGSGNTLQAGSQSTLKKSYRSPTPIPRCRTSRIFFENCYWKALNCTGQEPRYFKLSCPDLPNG